MQEIENREFAEAKEYVYEVPESTVRKPTNLFDKCTVSLFSTICFTMAMLLVVIISAATVMRYILEMDLYGYEEWIKIFAFWLYFMGAGYGAFAGSHITADLVTSYLKESLFRRLIIFTKTVITLGVTLLFTYYAFDFFKFSYLGPLGTGVAIPKSVAWRIPLWTGYLSIVTGLSFMSYYFAWDMIRATKALIKGGKTA